MGLKNGGLRSGGLRNLSELDAIPDSVTNRYPITSSDTASNVDDSIGTRDLTAGQGSTLTTDSLAQENRYFALDGNDDSLATSDVSNLHGDIPISVSMWVDISSGEINNSDSIVAVNQSGGGFTSGQHSWELLWRDTGDLEFAINGGNEKKQFSDANVVDQGWTMLSIIAVSSSQVALYYNGNNQIGSQSIGTIPTNGTHFAVGGPADGTGRQAQFDVDDIHLGANSEFSTTDLDEIYNSHPRA